LIQLATNSSLFSFVGFTISLWRVFFWMAYFKITHLILP
jgi:hypothetical protein